MINKVLCSTGFIGFNTKEKDHKKIIEYAPLFHCSGFEFMMFRSWYDHMQEVITDLRASDLSFPVFHMEKSIGELISRNQEGDVETAIENFRKNCYMASEIGSEKLVLHLWGGIPSDSDIENNYNQLELLLLIAKLYGVRLTIENVVCNHQNPMTHLAELRKRFPEIVFTFDTKMAAFHSELDLIYEPENDWLWNEQKIDHFHINDYGGGHMEWAKLNALPLGDGHIDLEKFFTFLKGKEYSGYYTLEASSKKEDGTLDIDKMNRNLDYIRGKINVN